jgi:hypothetical protein
MGQVSPVARDFPILPKFGIRSKVGMSDYHEIGQDLDTLHNDIHQEGNSK